jgi:hypothetical protein
VDASVRQFCASAKVRFQAFADFYVISPDSVARDLRVGSCGLETLAVLQLLQQPSALFGLDRGAVGRAVNLGLDLEQRRVAYNRIRAALQPK